MADFPKSPKSPISPTFSNPPITPLQARSATAEEADDQFGEEMVEIPPYTPVMDRGRSGRSTSISRTVRSNASSSEYPRHRIRRTNTVRKSEYNNQREAVGAEPGLSPHDVPSGIDTELHAECQITVMDFSPERVEQFEHDNAQFLEFLGQKRPAWVKCRWININKLSWDVISAVGAKWNLHRLGMYGCAHLLMVPIGNCYDSS